MFVRVGDSEEDIIQAAKTFGDFSENAGSVILSNIENKVDGTMRAEAFKVTFHNLNSQKREFGEAISSSVQQDLKKTGLVLDSVAITTIRQVAVNADEFPSDVFEAEGVRNITEIVERNRKETNDIRRQREIEIQQRHMDARKASLDLDFQTKQAEADQVQSVDLLLEREVSRAVVSRHEIA